MKAEVGKYKYGRHRSMWGIWQWDWVSETGSSARFIKDVRTYEEAVTEVYRLNGWGTPKYINLIANLWKKSHYSYLGSEIFHRLINFEG